MLCASTAPESCEAAAGYSLLSYVGRGEYTNRQHGRVSETQRKAWTNFSRSYKGGPAFIAVRQRLTAPLIRLKACFLTRTH